jgi:hypothetical protein
MALEDFVVSLKDQHGHKVDFEVTPDLIETRNVNYSAVDPTHMPGQIYTYKNTSSRLFNLSNARFISRTENEAQRNLIWLWRLRGWCMPEFGTNDETDGAWPFPGWEVKQFLSVKAAQTDPTFNARVELQEAQFESALSDGINPLGTPPDLLHLTAYSNRQQQHLYKIPVVMQQLSIPYPSDVDYITTKEGTPMPTIMTLDMTLVETHAPNEYETFNLSKYKQGVLESF